MANVLPHEAKRQVWRMYRARFALVLSLFLIALSALFSLALVPSILALAFAAPPVPGAPSGPSAPSAAAQVSRAQALVRSIAPVLAASTSPSALITEALGARPAGVVITTISHDASGRILLSGTGSRAGINAYRDLLAADPAFGSVSVPVSSLVGSEGPFSITLTFTP